MVWSGCERCEGAKEVISCGSVALFIYITVYEERECVCVCVYANDDINIKASTAALLSSATVHFLFLFLLHLLHLLSDDFLIITAPCADAGLTCY